MDYSEVQKIAKQALSYARKIIEPGMPLPELRKLCENEMMRLGADSFWYWNIGALCFSGDETAVSVSGKKYRTSDRVIAADDIITIDLSPQRKKIWGDYARTVVLEKGRVVEKIENISNDEWRAGLLMEECLHRELEHFATPATTFEELYDYMKYCAAGFLIRRRFKISRCCGHAALDILLQRPDLAGWSAHIF